MSNNGSPSGSRPNFIRGLIEANGGLNPTAIANFNPDLPGYCGGSSNDLTAQSASIGATTLFTPYIAGLYRITLYVGVTTTGNSVNITPAFIWNDGSGGKTQNGAVIAANGLNVSPNDLIIYSAGGQAIGYSVTVSAAIGAGRYQVHACVERLN